MPSDFISFELADPNDRTCTFGKRNWRWKIYSRQNQLNAVFFRCLSSSHSFFLLKIARLSIDGETMGTNIHYLRISGLSTDCFDATFHFESEQRIRYDTRCYAMWCTYKIRLTNVSSNPASVRTLAHFKLIISHFISSKHIIEISLLVRESVCGFYIFAHHLKSNCLECAMPLMSWNHCPS